jgi:hypothetical protein
MERKQVKGVHSHHGGSRGFMGFQRNVGFFGLLQALEVSRRRNLLDRDPGDPRRNFLGRRLIVNCRGNRRSSCGISLAVLHHHYKQKQVIYE